LCHPGPAVRSRVHNAGPVKALRGPRGRGVEGHDAATRHLPVLYCGEGHGNSFSPTQATAKGKKCAPGLINTSYNIAHVYSFLHCHYVTSCSLHLVLVNIRVNSTCGR